MEHIAGCTRRNNGLQEILGLGVRVLVSYGAFDARLMGDPLKITMDFNTFQYISIHFNTFQYISILPSGKQSQKTIWKDPPFYQWVNPLFRLGHVQVRISSFLYVYQRHPEANFHPNFHWIQEPPRNFQPVIDLGVPSLQWHLHLP